MNPCQKYEDDLKAYTDGELTWLRSLAVRRHLTLCASCREEIIAMTQIAEDLRSTESKEVLPPTLREKLISLEAPPLSENSASSRSGRSTRAAGEVGSRKRPALAWGLAGAALVAWFVLFPTFQGVRENARNGSPTAHFARRFRQDKSASSAAPSVPPRNFTANLPSSESEISATGSAPISAKSAPVLGNAQTFDASANSISIPDPLRQVHKEASIGVKVPNPETTGDTVATMVKEAGGYVAENNLSTGDDGLKSAEMTVKVPVTQFEPFLAQVAKLGSVQSKNITGEDITEKTSDANQAEGVLEDDVQKSEAGLKAMGSRAKWRDQEATRELRTQLAQARARLVLLKRLAALGTITVELTQTPKALTPPPVTGGFLNTLRATTHDALQSLVGSASALLALLIWLLAYSPLWVTLFFIGRYVQKAYRRREA